MGYLITLGLGAGLGIHCLGHRRGFLGVGQHVGQELLELVVAFHAAEELRQLVAHVQQLLERALGEVSLGVLLAGLDRRITHANTGFTRLTGYTQAELLGKSCRILQGPQTEPATVARLKAAFRADGLFDGEILNYRKDGVTFWNTLNVSPVFSKAGELQFYFTSQVDMTASREQQLRIDRAAVFRPIHHVRSSQCVIS